MPQPTAFDLALSGHRAPVDYDRAATYSGMITEKDVARADARRRQNRHRHLSSGHRRSQLPALLAFTAEFLFIAGQVATDHSGKVVGADDFDAQCGQVFANIGAALKSQGASFANVVEFTTYLVHSQDIAKFMAYRKREFPRLFANGAYPPNTLLIVDRLVQESFLIEVQTVAAL